MKIRIKNKLKNLEEPSKLIKVNLPKSKSRIVQENDYFLFCAIYKNLAGLFRKDIKETKFFGRKICDLVKIKLNNRGFFTSDEIPNYGLTMEEVDNIYRKTNATQSDLIVFFAYEKEEAKKTILILSKLLKSEKNLKCSPPN